MVEGKEEVISLHLVQTSTARPQHQARMAMAKKVQLVAQVAVVVVAAAGPMVVVSAVSASVARAVMAPGWAAGRLRQGLASRTVAIHHTARKSERRGVGTKQTHTKRAACSGRHAVAGQRNRTRRLCTLTRRVSVR